ncbi:MAG: fibrobacter succinogenes major paralogous domain-containing protein, partial [Crocinitomicaceae bacterium]
MKNSYLLLILLMGLSLGLNAQTVTIGTQVWMTKNLNVSTFRNGDPIPEAKTDEEWKKAGENQQPAWCYYDNNPANGAKYGKFYNWYAVNDPRGLAPEGYHVPTDAGWTQLSDYLGGEDVAGKKMKSTSG